MEHYQLLCDISDLNHLFRQSASVENLLDATVQMVTRHLHSDVCSIYLYDEETEMLVMRATAGLNPESVGQVRMKLGEGLTGMALKELRPICVSRASKHPDYKLFVGTDEEQFDNFLAVPITRGLTRIGVLTLQRKKRTKFREEDIRACRAVASQLANIIENARFVIGLHVENEPAPPAVEQVWHLPAGLEVIHGQIAAEGVARGPCRVLDKERTFEKLQQRTFDRSYTLEQFDEAVRQTESQLEELQSRVEEKLSDAASLIFASHLLILKDRQFVGTMRRLIEDGQNPPAAVLQVARQYIDIFTHSTNRYIREKVQDVEDLITRLLGNLLQDADRPTGLAGAIVIARTVFPSDLLQMSSEGVAGAVLVGGGVTGHVSILARSLQIPMVIANRYELLAVPDGTEVLLDAETGTVFIAPSRDVATQFERRHAEQRRAGAVPAVRPQTHTADGTRVRLLANINLLGDIQAAHAFRCEGVGLYRTEFPFIIRRDFPSEQEQYQAYRRLVTGMRGKPVTFRTLDIGGDKVLSYYHNAEEKNPGMGMRSIRFSLRNQPVFLQQLRAMLRAGLGADLGIMFPMIASTDDLRQARAALDEAQRQLDREGVPHNARPRVGIMVELPSAVYLADSLAAEVDFFSIGTNDLIQFMLGVDRTNENVADFYIPHHPAILRAIQVVVDAAHRHGAEVSVCGDMAHMPEYVPLLLGLGVRTLSIDPGYMPRVQQAVEQTHLDAAGELAAAALAAGTVQDVARLLGLAPSAEQPS